MKNPCKYLNERLAKANVSRIVIEAYTWNSSTITICTGRPGIVIGKGGQDVDTQLKEELKKKLYNKDIQINIFEVKTRNSTLLSWVTTSLARWKAKSLTAITAIKMAIKIQCALVQKV